MSEKSVQKASQNWSIFLLKNRRFKDPQKRYYGGLYDDLGDLFFTIDRFLELVLYQNSGPKISPNIYHI